MKTFFSCIGAAVFLMTACAPQAELVKTRTEMTDLRDDVKALKTQSQEQKRINQETQKRIETIDTNVRGTVDIQKGIADYGAKTDQLLTDIQLLQGKLEENNFRIADLGQKLDDKSFKIAELAARIDELETKLKAVAAGQGVQSGPSGTDKKAAKAPEPSEVYRQALNDYNSGNYDLALAGFENYLTRFPDSSQADKARYWIGECYYAQKDYGSAIEALTKLIKNHPKSEKAAAAKLKIGYAYLGEKNPAKGKEWLNRVVKEYPRTKEAGLAKDRLKKLK
jgi:tol-pal system protein YbgF